MVPSLVTCPTMKTVVFVPLARRISRDVQVRTWLTVADAEAMPESCIVWIESMTTKRGLSEAMWASITSISVSASSSRSDERAPSRSARIFTCWTDSSPVTYSVAVLRGYLAGYLGEEGGIVEDQIVGDKVFVH